jgi:hypothetical protein
VEASFDRAEIRRKLSCACDGGCPYCSSLIQRKPGNQGKSATGESFIFNFEWNPAWDPYFEKRQGIGLYGLGSYRPHDKAGCWIGKDFCGKPPTVRIVRNDKDKTTQVNVTCYAKATILLPVKQAYPVYADKDEKKNNVLDDKKLGVRTPPTAEGKGHWWNVAEHLKFYSYEHGGRLNEMKWWVPGSTEYHESVHHRDYKKWFKAMENYFRQKIIQRYLQETQENAYGLDMGKMKTIFEAIIKELLENDPKLCGSEHDDEKIAYGETRENYWLKESKRIKEYFINKLRAE